MHMDVFATVHVSPMQWNSGLAQGSLYLTGNINYLSG